MKINLLGGDTRHACLVEESPPTEKWVRYYPTRFQDNVVDKLTKMMHDDTKLDARNCSALLNFINRLLLKACKETVCIEFQISPDSNPLTEQKDDSIITVTVTSNLLRNLHCLLHYGDAEEKLKLVFSAVLPSSEGAFECFNLQPKATVADSGHIIYDHSTYQQANIRVPSKFFRIKSDGGKSSPSKEEAPHHWTVGVKLDLEVNSEDMIPRESILPEMFDFLRNIYHDKQSCDVAIVTREGSIVNCHKVFLTCHSDVFRAMFSRDCNKECNQTNHRVELMEMTEGGVTALLEFLYLQGLTKPKKDAGIALELLKAGYKYNIGPLSRAMEVLMLGKPNEWFDLDMALNVFLFARQFEKGNNNYELKEKVMDILAKRTDELNMNDVLLKNGAFTKELCLELFSMCLSKCHNLEEKLEEKRSPTPVLK